MKRSIYPILFCFTVLFSQFNLSGQNFLSTHGQAIINETGDSVILRGMGLGGWMLQEGYMLQTASFASAQYQIREKIEGLIGPADTELFYEAWLANHMRKIDVDSLKSWGFNSVRLPMNFELFTLPIEEEPVEGAHTWLNKGFELTDSLISWCAANEMYVILDLHAAPGGQGYDQGISNYDPTKPSLWETQANKDKTIALWKRLAERYADEQWVAGYDLINEPNWDIPGGIALRNLYVDITTSIRTVDNRHIIFIEGNWFANDFTGLTPPWDNNLVYSPHKYWSINDEGSIRWALNIRKDNNVPIYFGESGENSNVWFRDAIRLFEDNNIGWAWWPLKKIESIAGPLSVIKTSEYQALLNYWENGGSQPSAAFAKATLMEITENLKLENCFFQKDVIDAMFRQVNADELVPYNTQDIPGVVYASDYDMGVVGSAYHDVDVANYQVSTGQFTAWNTGWAYRNDGVDLQVCTDQVNTNGFNVAWVETDEWITYDIDVTSDAVYDIHVRYAAGEPGGIFHFLADDADISIPFYTSNTGGWQTWRSLTIPNIVLNKTDKKLKLYADHGGFNISSFEFIEKGATNTIPTKYISAVTADAHTVQLNINKSFDQNSFTSIPADFEIMIDGSVAEIENIQFDAENARIIYLTITELMKFDQTIKISYSGKQITDLDGVVLDQFTRKLVKNTLPFFHAIPGKIEAEDFFFQSGVQLESANDDGGGQNIGHLDIGDYLDYNVDVVSSGVYEVKYRVASERSGSLALQVIDDNGLIITVDEVDFPSTNGWQNWITISQSVQLPAGRYTMRLLITKSAFNMNWLDFDLITVPTKEPTPIKHFRVFPNPTSQYSNVEVEIDRTQSLQMSVYNQLGQKLLMKVYPSTSSINQEINLEQFNKGIYTVVIILEDGSIFSRPLLKS